VQSFALIMISGIEKYRDNRYVIRYNSSWREHRNLLLPFPPPSSIGGALYLVVIARSLINAFRLARLIRTARPT
jgi:hypothetical protein